MSDVTLSANDDDAAKLASELAEVLKSPAILMPGRLFIAEDTAAKLLLPAGLAPADVAALALVAGELARQRTAERHSIARDDSYPVGVLETAGGEYLTHAGYHRRDDFPVGRPSDSWPWDAEHWKPKTPIRDATRGCALGVAGISHRLRRGERAEG
ncbi:hypothetical protein MCW82_07170 [Azospirillum doebereinerae]|uniref:hypothetical protein n=1 Tax=Azospirillum doebereinerae TaxID=92933 RepID=UPI001EE5B6B2|nr:hypothetical protein [Azospirillum doebereinerae]MCG5239548.1 hypothetical protein [Azospirillum doebereinerae]